MNISSTVAPLHDNDDISSTAKINETSNRKDSVEEQEQETEEKENSREQHVVPLAVTVRNVCFPYSLRRAGVSSSSSSYGTRALAKSAQFQSDLHIYTVPFGKEYSSPIRIEMEIVVPPSILVELKDSYPFCLAFQQWISQLLEQGEQRNLLFINPDDTLDQSTDITTAIRHDKLVRLCSAHMYLSKTRNNFNLNGTWNDNVSKSKETRVVMSQLFGTQSHPLWDHIQDSLDDLYDKLLCHHGPFCHCRRDDGHHGKNQHKHMNGLGDDDKHDYENDKNDYENDNHVQTTSHRQESHVPTSPRNKHDNHRKNTWWEKLLCSAMVQCLAIFDDEYEHGSSSNGHEKHENNKEKSKHHRSCDDGDDGNHENHGVDNDNRNDDDNFKERCILLGSVPLHHSGMIPLPLAKVDKFSHNMQRQALSVVGESKYANAIPSSLPRNAILVHYSDGTTRVSSKLYQMLVDNHVIEDNESEWRRRAASNVWEKYEKRFDDNVFQVLQDGSVHQIDGIEDLAINSSSSVLYKSKANETIKMKWNGNNDNDGNKTSNIAMEGHPFRSNSRYIQRSGNVVRGSFAEAFQSLSMGRENDHGLVASGQSKATCVNWNQDSNKSFRPNENENKELFPSVLGSDDNFPIISKIQSLEEEIEKLQELLIWEEDSLRKEQEKQQMNVLKLKEMMEMVASVDAERKDIEEQTTDVENKFNLEKSLVQNKRRELLEELREQIYPIQTEDIFTICGVPIPKDMHSLSASDEIISAGLGFICLMVIMCSKYLSVPLRYRLIFNSSRSAVREDSEVYPLFKERVVEKEQFDRGVVLLNRNIEHLLEMQGVLMTKEIVRTHILAKVDLLFKSIGK